jgi:cytosine/adenosine deaminase-related metal-dependent hydrolase
MSAADEHYGQALRYHARVVRPVSGPDIDNGTVVVEGELITYVGPRSDAPPGKDIELGDVMLAPGLVNAHTHLDLTALRGRFDGLKFFEWIRALTAARQAMSPDELLESSRAGIREGLRAGITTFADTAPNDAPFEAMRELGVRGIAYREVFGPDPKQCDESMAAFRQAVAAMHARRTTLVHVGVSPHAPYSVSDELFSAVADFALTELLPLATHVAESREESSLVANGEGEFATFLRGRGILVTPRARTPIELLERLGVLGANALLIHCIRCDDHDIATIAKHRCGVATCPISNQRLGHGPARVPAMLIEDIHVGIGTDSMASNERMDLLAESRLAQGARVTERETWELATLGGARALRLDHLIGSLEPGKQADLAAFPLGADPGVPTRAGFVAVAGKVLTPD